MLVGAVVNIASNANLLFKENYAENTGGAIFVVHPQMMINAHNYISSCFYQLLNFDSILSANYSINFINNSAAKGGDHIYGVSLKSGCVCATTEDVYTILLINENTINSYIAFDLYFLLDPGYKSIISAVSADAMYVCICDINGQPQCGTVVKDLYAYPGGHFALNLAVVGGDHGTTTGNVYTSFLYENSTSVFGYSDQYHQVITKSSECSVLNFSINSNESHDIIFLIPQETLSLIKSARDHYNEYISCIEMKCS